MKILSKRKTYRKKKCSELKIHGAEYIDPLPSESPECTEARQVKIYKSIDKAKARRSRAETTPDQKIAFKIQHESILPKSLVTYKRRISLRNPSAPRIRLLSVGGRRPRLIMS